MTRVFITAAEKFDWKCVTSGFSVLSTDVSHRGSYNGGGAVVQDSEGNLVGFKFIPLGLNLTELEAGKEGLHYLLNGPFKDVAIIRFDCDRTYRYFEKMDLEDFSAKDKDYVIKTKSSFKECRFIRIRSKDNFLADKVARETRLRAEPRHLSNHRRRC
ncbi:hypothetical protein V6N13_056683 [Hibiscus sabdariffa]|uniref:RNase H type-1 domain-containing protein n=1 Tax=Hibiscus sabdariffa TaxID=183260 RepID=A0ABR2AHM7_9ROSI